MKASETRLQPIFEGTKQYVVPLFQRPYSWTKKEWDILFADLQEIASLEEPRAHFLGSIVTLPTVSVPEGVAKYMLIDGQQRLTTVLIILTVIRDLARAAGNNALADEINLTLIVNQFKKDGDHQKLLPTQGDRKAFGGIVVGNPDDTDSQVWKAYNYFKSGIKAKDLQIDRVKKILCNDLSVVSIVLDPDDNPHLVFESLNAKGRALSAADLIRNYFFMRIHVRDQDVVYDKYWKPMEIGLDANLTECIRHYLMKDGKVVRRDDVYFVLKEGVTKENAVDRLSDLARFAGYYERLLYPIREIDPDIRAAIERFNRLETNSAFPFLLNCFDDYNRGVLLKAELIDVFKTLENFVVRRFVCNIATKYLSTIFPALYQQAKSYSDASFNRALCLVLQTKGYPRDTEFRSRLVDGKLYGSGDRALKTKLILETFESSYGHKEGASFSTLTLEHLMPQTVTQSWKSALGQDWQEVHELYLHTIGNLTLTGYNPELSNSDWNRKRAILLESKLELNKYFASKDCWRRENIEQRSRDLSEMALRAWPYFGDGSVADTTSVTGTTPQRLKILGAFFDVHSWRDVLENTMNVISDLEPEKFEVLLSEFPRFISRQSGNLRERRQLTNGAFVEVNLSAQAIQKFCFQAIESIELSTDDWIVQYS
jgi:uncharacterized protein with ParB-like and HNH nuclease domain